MPGENCCVVNCNTSRKTLGIGIFKLPSKEKRKEWRNAWLHEIIKTRVIDKSFRELIEKDRVYTCERHFKTEVIKK